MFLHAAPCPELPAHTATTLGGLAEDSIVLTRSGEERAGDLAAGARVITRDGGFRTLAAVTSREVTSGTLVRVAAGALGACRPERDLLLAPDQRLLVRGARAIALVGQPRIIAPAAALVDGDAITTAEVTHPQRLCTLHFEDEHIIYASGVEALCTPAG